MSTSYTGVVKTAQEYYNSDDADNFYFHIWGGEDIHVGIYKDDKESIGTASERTVATMANNLDSSFTPDSRVVDLGAGYGGAARWLSQKYGCHVSCVNLSEAQNVRNREISKKSGLADKIDVIDGSFENLDFADNSMDIAWSQDSILHSGKRGQVLEEVDRVLKPGGQFIFTDPMQADDCPEGVLQPVLDRIHLESLGSFAFYRSVAKDLNWEELSVTDMTPQLVNHYTRVRQELISRREELQEHVSAEYIERMAQGLTHWIEAGKKGYLSWGIMCFQTAS
ncbi:MAG: methyltransferase domain-containing protein [Gammaproteobacteria bacterium]